MSYLNSALEGALAWAKPSVAVHRFVQFQGQPLLHCARSPIYAFIWIASGQLALRWRDADGVEQSLCCRTGSLSVLLVNPDLSEELQQTGAAEGYCWIGSASSGEQSFPARDLATIHGLSHILPASVQDMMAWAYRDARSNDRFRSQRLYGLLVMLISSLLRAEERESTGTKGQLSAEQIQQLETFLRQRLSLRVNSADLAQEVNLSRGHFTKCLRQTFGIGAREWIVYQRMRYAAAQLHFSARRVVEIATELGYDDCSVFCRQFKQWYGKTPLQFRKNPSHGQLDLWQHKNT